MTIYITPHRAGEPLPDALDALISEAEQDGWHHLTRLKESFDEDHFCRAGEVLLLAWARDARGEVLIGVGGVSHDPYLPDDTRTGRIRRVYLARAWRRRGLGRALVEALFLNARQQGRFDVLRLRTHDAGAAAFYERLGFARCDEEHATHHRAV